MQIIVGTDPQKDSLYICRKDDTRDFPKTEQILQVQKSIDAKGKVELKIPQLTLG